MKNIEHCSLKVRRLCGAGDLNSALKASSNLFDTNQWSKYQQLFQFTNAQVSPNDINGLIDFITSNKFNNIVNL